MLKPIIGRTRYPLDVIDLEPHEEIGFDCFVIAGFPVNHRVEAFGYAFIEDDRPGRFDVETARRLGVTEGPDFGRLQRGETVNGVTPEQVVGPDRPGRRIVYSGDTAPIQTVEVYAHDADVLVHEATFCEDEKARARETGHSTARQAAQLAPTPTSSCSRSPTCAPATSRATSATRRERSSRTPSSRATSTRSRSRSPSAAPPNWSRPSWSRPRRRTRARPGPCRRGRPRRLEPPGQAGRGQTGSRSSAPTASPRPSSGRPFAVADALVEGHITWPGVAFMAGSAVLHIGYFGMLQRAYATGDLSVVYPLARGTGPSSASPRRSSSSTSAQPRSA